MNVKALQVPAFRTLQVLAMLSAIIAGSITTFSVVHDKLNPHLRALTLDEAVWWALLFQTIAIFFLLGFLRPLPKTKDNPEFEVAADASRFKVAVDASRQFWRYWVFLWATWFCLYLTWFLTQPLPPFQGSHFIGDLLNMLSAASAILCYLVMTLRTVPPKKYAFHNLVFWVISSCLLFAVIELFLARNHPELKQPFHWIQGLISGVALALLVGRLDSRLIDTPRPIIAALYSYAVIQFSYPVLQENKLILLVMTSSALFLKILLFWQISSILLSGKIFWYMFEYRKIYDQGQTEKEEFLHNVLIPVS